MRRILIVTVLILSMLAPIVQAESGQVAGDATENDYTFCHDGQASVCIGGVGFTADTCAPQWDATTEQGDQCDPGPLLAGIIVIDQGYGGDVVAVAITDLGLDDCEWLYAHEYESTGGKDGDCPLDTDYLDDLEDKCRQLNQYPTRWPAPGNVGGPCVQWIYNIVDYYVEVTFELVFDTFYWAYYLIEDTCNDANNYGGNLQVGLSGPAGACTELVLHAAVWWAGEAVRTAEWAIAFTERTLVDTCNDLNSFDSGEPDDLSACIELVFDAGNYILATVLGIAGYVLKVTGDTCDSLDSYGAPPPGSAQGDVDECTALAVGAAGWVVDEVEKLCLEDGDTQAPKYDDWKVCGVNLGNPCPGLEDSVQAGTPQGYGACGVYLCQSGVNVDPYQEQWGACGEAVPNPCPPPFAEADPNDDQWVACGEPVQNPCPTDSVDVDPYDQQWSACGEAVPNPCPPPFAEADPDDDWIICGQSHGNPCPTGGIEVDPAASSWSACGLERENPCPSPHADVSPGGTSWSACGETITNPCPEGVDLEQACGKPIPDPCPQGVDPSQICGTPVPDPCPEGVDLEQVCGEPIPDPCPEGADPQQVCGTPVPDPCPEGVDLEQVCGTQIPDPCPEGADPQQVCGTPVPDPCPEGADPQQVCGTPVPEPCPGGFSISPHEGSWTICGAPVGYPLPDEDADGVPDLFEPTICYLKGDGGAIGQATGPCTDGDYHPPS